MRSLQHKHGDFAKKSFNFIEIEKESITAGTYSYHDRLFSKQILK
jgi:hypothetical protein